jgi:Vitamin K-dependent gamma-carboxylase
MQKIWQNITYIDPRSYVGYRIILGLAILVDLLFSRFGSVSMFLSDTGAVPRKMLIEYMGFSLFAASGGALWSYILLSILTVAAFCMIIGLRTKTATIAAYILVLSLHWRLETVLGGPDRLLLVLLFWAIFLPLGQYGSIDAIHVKNQKEAQPILSKQIAIFGTILVASCMYAIAAGVKQLSDDWYKDFTAVYFVLQTGYHTTWLGDLIKNQVLLTKILTVTTLIIEWLLGTLLFVPFFTQYTRSIFVVLILCLNIGFGSMLSVGLFPVLGIGLGILFMPSVLWNKIHIPKTIQKNMNVIAKKTIWFYKTPQNNRKFQPYIVIFLAVNIIIQCLVNIDDVTDWKLGNTLIEQSAKYYIRTLRIDQNWIMFRRAPRYSAWPEVIVTTEQNTEHDIWRQQWAGTDVVSTQPPKKVSDALLLSLRLFLYFDKLGKPENEGNNIHLFYAHYICKQWNQNHANNYAKTISYYQTFTHWKGIDDKEVFEREKKWSYDCPESTKTVPDIWYEYMK